MVRTTFEHRMDRILDEVMVLGSMVEHALLEAVEYLRRRDLVRSQKLIDQDRIINKRRFDIEEETLVLIATQQPMAGDLRKLAAVLEVVTELERIGDYAKGIAKISLLIGEDPFVKPLVDIPRMAAISQDMLHRALDAFARFDVDLARKIPSEDDQVDDLYNQVYRELATFLVQDARNIDQVNYLLWAAHNLERAADRVTNICERVVFAAEGRMQELDQHFDED